MQLFKIVGNETGKVYHYFDIRFIAESVAHKMNMDRIGTDLETVSVIEIR